MFILLISADLAVDTDDVAFSKILRNTNIANMVVWSYWWPLIIILSVVIGRVWCIICPMELLTSLTGRFGLKRLK
ncbi:4Fe-4S binding protein [bacterium]|nr:4Fe-4S binding protein [bacterium]